MLSPGERLYAGPLADYKPVTPEYGEPAEDATPYDVPHLPDLNEDNVPPLPGELTEEMSNDEVMMYEFLASFVHGADAGGDKAGRPHKRALVSWDQFVPGNSTAFSGDSLPVDYEAEGVLLVDVEIGISVYVARGVPSGAIRIFTSSPVTSMDAEQGWFRTANSFYRVEPLGEPGGLAALAEEVLRKIRA
ncbi:MAG: hypothetical protein ABSH34_14285 [Verrucomicrobiota bacterium]